MACSQRGMVVSERKIFKNGHLSSVKFQNFAVFSIFHHFPPLLVKILNTQPTHLIITLSPHFSYKKYHRCLVYLSNLSKRNYCQKFFSHFSSKSGFFSSKKYLFYKKFIFQQKFVSHKNKFLGKNFCRSKKLTTPEIPRTSPIQVLIGPNVA